MKNAGLAISSMFLNDFGNWKIWSEEKKPEANFFGSERFNSTQLFWILKTQKMLAEGFFFLNSQFWSWKGVQNELFLYWITFLPCSYEAKVKNKKFFFPREKKFLFFPDSPNTIRNGAEKKSNPLYKKVYVTFILHQEHISPFEMCVELQVLLKKVEIHPSFALANKDVNHCKIFFVKWWMFGVDGWK